MNRKLFFLYLLAASVTWCETGFAQQQTAVGPGLIPLNATGVLNGVAMSASATTGTLTVGVPGGPPMDIFTLNNPPLPGLVAVSTAASSQGNILFNSGSTVYGAIGTTQPGGPFLLNISGGNTGTAVNFQGPVFATMLNVTGTGAVNFNSGSTNIVATNFAADGFINLAPNTTLIGALTTTAGANTGTLGLGGGSVLNGAVGGAVGLRSINVVGGDNTAGVTATITGAVNSYAFNLGTNTLNIGGALTIANSTATGVINTTLASPSVFGNISPVGRTNLGSTLQINVTVPSSALIPVGTQFNIVQTRLGTVQSGTDGSVLNIQVQNPTNPLYTFTAVPPAGTVAGLVAIRTASIPILVPIQPPPTAPPIVIVPPPVVVVTPPALVITPIVAPIVIPPLPVPIPAPVVPLVPVAAPVVPVLLFAPATPDLVNTVLPALNALAAPAQVVVAEAQLTPSTADLAAPLVTFQVTRQFENLWLSHMDDVMCGQISEPEGEPKPDAPPQTCQKNDPHSGWWMKGFGYWGNQGSQGPYAGYDSRTFGTMIAYDAPIRDFPLDGETRVGFGVGYARSEIDGNTFSSNTDFNTYQVTAYAGHEQGPWFVHGDVSFGWNDYSGTRQITFPGVDRTAQANYSGQDYTGFITTGYHFAADAFTLTPLASLQYTYMNLNSYTETGAGDINLRVNSQSYNFLESGLGAEVAHAFPLKDGTFVPQVHAKWLHEFSNPTAVNTASFAVPGSLSFTTPGLNGSTNTLNAGIGVTFLSCACTAKTWSLEAVYDYYRGTQNYSAQQTVIRFTSRF